ncbi:hypothetical protein [Mesorhizobium australicum]|uniref:Uncharacterized protein n=1 Tax=Mesorhizobium australicum TaxID=536018 RepID=A0A1X7NY94_9HYPH|nr:hypothetical protein [Mesorhizobium australicum]SMH43197.1 hypothetical protein SAMN02982922_2851 [Mesorhizobium australicum]
MQGDEQKDQTGTTGGDIREDILKTLDQINGRIQFIERNYDPGVLNNKTSNVIAFISLLIVGLGLIGGSSFIWQSQQTEVVNRRLDEFRAEIDRGADRSINDIDRQFVPLKAALEAQALELGRRYDQLERDLTNRLKGGEQTKDVSIRLISDVIQFREAKDGWCTGHIILGIVNNTEFLTELVYLRRFSKIPIAGENLSWIDGWEGYSQHGLEKDNLLAGSDSRPFYLSVGIGPRWHAALADGWSEEKLYPIKVDLYYLNEGGKTGRYGIEQSMRVSADLAACAKGRGKLLR